MIKRNELAYGNWVLDDCDFPMYVTGVFDDEAYLDFDGNEGDVWEEKYEDIKPIALTEELLLIFGFKKEQDNICGDYEYTIYIGEYPIRINKYSNTINRDWNIHIDNNVHDTILSADIQYVHQLQNAIYFATKQELDVSNILK